jgi:hypothetical protein
MPYKKSNKQVQEQKLGPLKKKIKNLALNKELDNDSESGGYTGQPKQHGSPFEMSAKRYNNSPMQKNFSDSLAITKKLDKNSMAGGLTGQPSGETGKIGSGPLRKNANPIKIGNPSNPMRQRFVKNVKNFGTGLKTAGKDIKHKLAGTAGRAKMVASGYKTPKQRRKPGTSSASTAGNSDKKFKTLNPKFQSVATGPQTKATSKLNKKSFPTKGPASDKGKDKSHLFPVGGGGGSFKDAFATARKGKKKSFKWTNPKTKEAGTYHTKTKKETTNPYTFKWK